MSVVFLVISLIQNYLFGGILFAAFWLPAGLWIYRQKIRTMKQIDEMDGIVPGTDEILK